jgi:uncharacterized iron-regulated protein
MIYCSSRWLIGTVICLCAATAAAAGEANWGDWAQSVRRAHPLAGDYFSVTERVGGPIRGRYPPGHQGPALRKEPGQAPYIVLLGEVHDNPAHHQLRAWMIENTVRTFAQWRPAIVFEQISADQKAAVEKFNARVEAGDGAANADELLRLLDWDKSGWPPGRTYKPLFAAAIAAKLPFYAGDPSPERVKSVTKEGLSLISAEERARLRLDKDLPEPLRNALGKELANGHCGTLPPEAVDGMAAAQRYRDASLADSALAAAEKHGSAILIAGNGHVRDDRGVPWYIRERAPTARVATVMILEVESGKVDPFEYVPLDPENRPVVDALIFTPAAERPDPCQSLLKNKS